MGNQLRGRTIKMMLNGRKIVAFYTITRTIDKEGIGHRAVEDVAVYDMNGSSLSLEKEEMAQVRTSCEKHLRYA